MKNYWSALVMCVLPLIVFSQEKPLPGYYIDLSGKRHEGFYKKSDFLDSESLKFSETVTGSFTALRSDVIAEYGIGSDYRFVKKQVNYEKSSSSVGYDKDAKLEKANLFLNVLVEGKASLYSYFDNGINRFFYSTADNDIKYLIYKKYHQSDIASIHENTQFHVQLWTDLKCDGIVITDVTILKYNDKDLIDFFKKYNACANVDSKVYSNKSGNKISFRYSLSAGIYQSRFSATFPDGETDPENATTFGFGGDISLVMPSGKNEFFGEVGYEQFSGMTHGNIKPTNAYPYTSYQYFKLDCSAIDIEAGYRHNWIIGDKSRIFADMYLNMNQMFGDVKHSYSLDLSGSIPSEDTFKTDSAISLGFDFGYIFDRHFGIELKYETPKNIMTNPYYKAKLSRFGINFRYLFN